MSPVNSTKNRFLGLSEVFVILALSSFLTRLLPLAISQYPFNNDSMSVCRISSQIMIDQRFADFDSSVWQYSHGVQTPVLSILISYFASAVGADPYQCAQLVDASFAVLTVGGIFILARMLTGSSLGGLTAGFMGLMMGTFVFTTGSAWNESLGISLLVLMLIAFVRRGQARYRLLTLAILIVLPLVHHVVAAVALLFIAYLLTWSWYFALYKRTITKRHYMDLALVVGVITWTSIYYMSVDFDRMSDVSEPIRLMLLASCFALLSIASIMILMPRRHLKPTFAPPVGVGLFALLVLDYSGLLFQYESSVSDAYIFLIAGFSFFFALAWYGTEILLEKQPVYRAVQVGLAISPLTLMGFGVLQGFSTSSQQVVYRVFDFLDLFVFVGAAAGLVALQGRKKRTYAFAGIALVVLLVVSFPFGYASDQLLGVRHDTQAYEIDALEWTDEHSNTTKVITDERLSYISSRLYGFVKDASLPLYLSAGVNISPDWVCMAEDRWTTTGVNAFPDGTIVVTNADYDRILSGANVFYVSGPRNDRAILFFGSDVGSTEAS